jgi:2-amino-4-hydroxy-6-hydroxymethyldihydropteridine diphosphokinase
VTTYIGMGSNVGDRTGFCRRAVTALEEAPGVKLETVSNFYETSPVGGPPQRSFINLVVRAFTDLEPRELLEVCKEVERRLGRGPNDARWGPRVMDLDILLYGEEKISEPGLKIPHPRIRERRFVLVPLLEIDPDLTDPWGNPYATSMRKAEGEVRLLDSFS